MLAGGGTALGYLVLAGNGWKKGFFATESRDVTERWIFLASGPAS
jgi:hypothetical protein